MCERTLIYFYKDLHAFRIRASEKHRKEKTKKKKKKKTKKKKKKQPQIQARRIREILRRCVWILDVSFSLGNFVLTSYRP